MDNQQSKTQDYSSAWLNNPTPVQDNSGAWMQPPTQGGSPSPSVFERFPLHHLWLADQFAGTSNQTMDLDGLMQNSLKGLSVDQQDQIDQNQKIQDQRSIMEQRVAELSAQLTQNFSGLDDTQFKDALANLKTQMSAPHATLQQAPLENPNLLQSGFALLGAALFPKQAGDIGASPFQTQLKAQQDQQLLNNQDYAIKEQNRTQGIANAQNLASLEGQQYRSQLENQTRMGNNIQTQMTQVQNSINRLDQQQQALVTHGYDEYNRANTYDEKKITGRRLQYLLKGTGLAPTDDEIEQAAQTQKLRSIDGARKDADSFIKRYSQDGVVDDSDASAINDHLRLTESLYGLPEGYLGNAPTYETVRKQALALAQNRFDFYKGDQRQKLQIAWANLHVAEQRQQTYAQSVANQAALGLGNLDQRAFGNQLDLYRLQTNQALKGYANESLPAIKKLQDELQVATKVAAQDPSKANNDKVVEAQEKLNLIVKDIADRAGISPMDLLKDPDGWVKRLGDAIDQGGVGALGTGPSVPGTPQIDATGAISPNQGTGTNSPPITFNPVKGTIGPGGVKDSGKKKGSKVTLPNGVKVIH